MNLSKELDIAIQIAKDAGEILMQYYNKEQKVIMKENDTPVGEADLASNDYIIENLKKHFPYPILSEESIDDKARMGAEKVRIVDPLDGTADFIKKTGEFTVVIGLLQDNQPIIGVVYRPTTMELYYAQKGQGSFIETKEGKEKLIVSEISTFAEGTFITGKVDDKYASYLDQKGIINRKRTGSAALTICKIAQREYDAYFKLNTKMAEWDDCAAGLILSEAGGVLSNIEGKTLLYNQEDVARIEGFAATNGVLHEATLTLMQDYLVGTS